MHYIFSNASISGYNRAARGINLCVFSKVHKSKLPRDVKSPDLLRYKTFIERRVNQHIEFLGNCRYCKRINYLVPIFVRMSRHIRSYLLVLKITIFPPLSEGLMVKYSLFIRFCKTCNCCGVRLGLGG